MGFFDFLSGNKEKSTNKADEIIAEKVLSTIRQQTACACISLSFKDEETNPYNSKIGGEPYLPEGFVYPVDKISEQPLIFLAQLNFSELPRLEGFPLNGILQFYIQDKSLYGLNLSDRLDQNSFRICFHSEVSENFRLYSSPITEYDKEMFPAHKNCRIEGRLTTDNISVWNWDFDEKLLTAYREVTGNDTEKVPENISNYIDENLHPAVESKIGGYPSFTQEDPRHDFQDYSILLLQLVSEETSGMMWGDCGIANFFMPPHDLHDQKFGSVMYNWDCY